MIYDFHGFPEELSQVQYPAPGSPELAEKVRSLLAPESVEMNPTRGFDHGAWTVLKYLYPDADVPVVQLSINRLQPAKWHFELAKKLAPLRDEGVLIIGSGNIVHNLRAISWEHINQIGAGYDWAFAFRDEINQAIDVQNDDLLVHYGQLGENAELAVPTPDHYLPLLYVMVHGRYNNWGGKTMLAVDIFRLENGKVVEHWDVMQEEVPADKAVNGNAMFPVK